MEHITDDEERLSTPHGTPAKGERKEDGLRLLVFKVFLVGTIDPCSPVFLISKE
jgi:hypothetical protein